MSLGELRVVVQEVTGQMRLGVREVLVQRVRRVRQQRDGAVDAALSATSAAAGVGLLVGPVLLEVEPRRDACRGEQQGAASRIGTESGPGTGAPTCRAMPAFGSGCVSVSVAASSLGLRRSRRRLRRRSVRRRRRRRSRRRCPCRRSRYELDFRHLDLATVTRRGRPRAATTRGSCLAPAALDTRVVTATSTVAVSLVIDSTAMALTVASVTTFESCATLMKSSAWPSKSFLKSPVVLSMMRFTSSFGLVEVQRHQRHDALAGGRGELGACAAVRRPGGGGATPCSTLSATNAHRAGERRRPRRATFSIRPSRQRRALAGPARRRRLRRPVCRRRRLGVRAGSVVTASVARRPLDLGGLGSTVGGRAAAASPAAASASRRSRIAGPWHVRRRQSPPPRPPRPRPLRRAASASSASADRSGPRFGWSTWSPLSTDEVRLRDGMRPPVLSAAHSTQMRMAFSILSIAPTIPHPQTGTRRRVSCGNAISALCGRSAQVGPSRPCRWRSWAARRGTLHTAAP